MTMSEESIPLMASYRSPHNGRRSFAMTSDVPRYSAQVYNAVLRRNRISFTTGQIILFFDVTVRSRQKRHRAWKGAVRYLHNYLSNER